MSYQLQDGRVERATSQWWHAPVVTACLRVLALLGFAGVAWAVATSSAHADAGSPALSGAVDSAAAPVTSIPEPSTAPVGRPLVRAVSPSVPYAAVAVSPVTGSTGGALAPATTPASDASVVDGAATLVTPVCGPLPADGRQSRSPGLLGSSALVDPLSTTQGITTSLGVDDAVAPLTTAVRPLTETTRPLTDRISSVVPGLPQVSTPLRPIVRLPIDDHSPWTGAQPVPATAERSTTPVQAALPAVPADQIAGPVDSSTAQFAAPAAHRPDSASGPAVGAGLPAPTLPAPGPGSLPVLPGAALHGGSAAGSSLAQHDGPTGAVGTGGLAARLLASRAFAVTEDSGVTLVCAEDPSVSPD
jgi:hypothetical protein